MTTLERIHSMQDWFYGKDHSATDPNWKSLDDLEKVSGGYFFIVILGFLTALIGGIILGSYINGARWINKKNIRVKGQDFVRSDAQNLVYKISRVLLAVLILFMGYMGTFSDYIEDSIDDKTGALKDHSLLYLIPFYRSHGSLMFQCNLAAVFIMPWLVMFNKVRALAIIAPFSFIGAMTTVFSQSDLASGNGYDGFEVHRKACEHILLMTLPLFMLVANRFRFTLSTLVGALIYTTIFNLAMATYVYVEKMGDADLPSQGEFGRAGEMLGYSQIWMHDHFWTLVVFILGPITFVMVGFLWSLYTLIFYMSTTKIEKNFNSWDKDVVVAGKEITFKLSLFAILGRKFIEGPKAFVKTFKENEKLAWSTWGRRNSVVKNTEFK